MPPHVPVGKRIRDTREASKVSQSELAKLVGLSTTAIWNWENRGRVPRRETLAKVAEALRVSEEYLTGEGEIRDLPGGNGFVNEDQLKPRPASPAMKRTPDTIAWEIEKARAKIAELAGLDVNRVRLKLTVIS